MIFLPFLLHNYVIHIVFQPTMHHVMEYGSHHALVSCTCFFQPKGRHSVVEITYGHPESDFLRILWHHSNLVVLAESIHE